ELSDRRGWRMTAYGLDPAMVPSGLPIDVKAPFAEDDLTAVLSGADVLVVPSVMRETFSILTREALLCGVPVVTSDTLGPEEVVVDGHNGLVVPAADPVALAHAIGRLLDDPALLAQLRNGAAAVAVRSIQDQVSANEARYQKLIDRRAADRERQPHSGACPPGIRNVVFAVGIEGAPLRYRARLPAEGLALLGVETSVVYYRDPALPALLASADAAVFYRVPATTNVLDLIATTRDRGCPVLFDVDDLIFDPDLAQEIPALSILPPAEAELWLQGVRRYRTTMEACDAFVGSTDQLCRHAAAVTGMPVERFSNGVGLLLGRMSDQALRSRRAEGPPRIGYFSGTTTHDRDWAEIEATVLDAMDRHLDLELWLVGHLKTSPEVARHRDRIRRWPMMPWTELPAMLRNVDLNLVPLELGSRFNEAKSAIKWLEASLVATPTIASPTQPFREVIDPGVTGFLAATPTDWGEAIDRLILDPDHLARVGARARRSALLEWSPHVQGRRYLAMLERTIEQTGRGEKRRPTIDWLPVALDEPPVAGQLEPYRLTPAPPIEESPVANRAVTLPPVATRVANLLRRGLESQRRDGTGVTLRRALRLLERRTVGFRHHLRRLVRRRR
ncbi:MAG: hypothetical protein QOG44_2737, partial [Acidimicrobiaceae bacterium]|nr:hypothetical protein [Acidimicrobiaceae bacterium]